MNRIKTKARHHALVLRVLALSLAIVAPLFAEGALPASQPSDIDPAWTAKDYTNRGGRRETEYMDAAGVLRAAEEYHRDGKTLARRTLYAGTDRWGRPIENGLERRWHTNGRLASVTPYLSQRIEGRCQAWAEDGTLVADYVMKDGTGTREVRYPSGTLKLTAPFVRGQKEGLWKSYWPNGQLQEICRYANGKAVGSGKNFYADGSIWYFSTVNRDGKTHGIVLDYDPKGEWAKPPAYYVNGEKVTKDVYVEACKDDKSLPAIPASEEELKKLPEKYDIK